MKKNILIVDDDAMTRDFLGFRLQQEGYEVEMLDDGLHAALNIRQKSPDLVILDVLLPDLSGLEVLALIREEWGLKEIPVFLMSRYGHRKLILLAERYGATNYFTKPLEIDQILQKISRLPQFAGEGT